MLHRFSTTCCAALAALLAVAVSGSAQIPLGYVAVRGQTVTPAYEGWYDNPDGTKTLSFGYYNRNREEVLEIPLGPDNFIEPARFDGVQPTRFDPVRHWGVFGVVVPGDFQGTVSWTLKNRGKTFTIPANLSADWFIDALRGSASGNMAPELAAGESGPWKRGINAVEAPPVSTTAGKPTAVTMHARDDGEGGGGFTSQRRVPTVTLTWFKHSGPGEVTFSEESAELPYEGGSMTTTATFSEPGEYVLRVRANDLSGVEGAGHAQCCWSNGFVKVTVR